MQFIDLKTQYASIKDSIDRSIATVLQHGQYIMGPEVVQLEQKLADYVGAKHCISVASGTMSLEIALRALGIGPGDEVITVPFTWISSSEVISLVGAKPVFVDIELENYNIDPRLIEPAITPRTKAIMAVSLFGQMPDMHLLGQIADRHGLVLIEDAAQSFGATQHGARSCGLAHISSTSFFPAKTLGCYGDGGALFTSDDRIAETMKAIRNHGGLVRHHHTLVGTNGRFDTIQAAVLLAKLPTFDWELAERARIGQRYSDMLRDVCSVPRIDSGNTHVYAQYTIRVPDRDALATHLKQAGIPTAIYYPKCLHEQPVYADLNYAWGTFPQSERASREVLSLPMHPFLSEQDQDRIVQAIRSHLQSKASHS
jgi:UDP-2-acetamido-2-deoxy-ribo-hexuluronate aminotransferase